MVYCNLLWQAVAVSDSGCIASQAYHITIATSVQDQFMYQPAHGSRGPWVCSTTRFVCFLGQEAAVSVSVDAQSMRLFGITDEPKHLYPKPAM